MHKKFLKLAAIDIGTNSFHLIVAEANLQSGRFKIISKEKEIVRLGSGTTDMKYLNKESMDRGIRVLQRLCAIADAYKASIRAIATSAVREAINQREFIQQVKNEIGVKIETASGVEEARLIYLGVLQALPVYSKKILLVDIGGGSTEFLIGKKKKIIYCNSSKVGAVRMTERFFRSDRINRKAIDECREYILGFLAPIMRDLKKQQYDVCIGTSGTILAIGKIACVKRGNNTDYPINGLCFSKEELIQVINEILHASTAKQRMEIEGMDPARVDIITAGAVILEQIIKALGIKNIIVSEYALREGILLDSIEKLRTDNQFHHLQDLRLSSVLHLADSFHYEKKHAVQVTKLALQLFDKTQSLHRLNAEAREYLEAASLLHEIGLYISHSQHHRHSYYLIRYSELLGYTENEKEIIANIARYHRKSHPKIKHDGYNALSIEDQRKVSILAGILRIADGLDRSHSSLIRKLYTRVSRGTLFIHVSCTNNIIPELELWGAERKKQLLQELLRKRILITCAR